VRALDAAVRRGVRPDLTVLLDCPLERGLRRATGDDRMQRERLEFHRRVQAGFHRLAAEDSSWVTISTEPPAEQVARQILSVVLAAIA
jgi:dTMP kinase